MSALPPKADIWRGFIAADQRSRRSLGGSDVNLLGYGERVVYLNAEIADRALDLGVPEQQLDCAEIARSAIDQRYLRSPQRMSSIKGGVEADHGDPSGDELRC